MAQPSPEPPPAATPNPITRAPTPYPIPRLPSRLPQPSLSPDSSCVVVEQGGSLGGEEADDSSEVEDLDPPVLLRLPSPGPSAHSCIAVSPSAAQVGLALGKGKALRVVTGLLTSHAPVRPSPVAELRAVSPAVDAKVDHPAPEGRTGRREGVLLHDKRHDTPYHMKAVDAYTCHFLDRYQAHVNINTVVPFAVQTPAAHIATACHAVGGMCEHVGITGIVTFLPLGYNVKDFVNPRTIHQYTPHSSAYQVSGVHQRHLAGACCRARSTRT